MLAACFRLDAAFESGERPSKGTYAAYTCSKLLYASQHPAYHPVLLYMLALCLSTGMLQCKQHAHLLLPHAFTPFVVGQRRKWQCGHLALVCFAAQQRLGCRGHARPAPRAK
eukprot:GHRQ01000571.1.p2 GENE.GHRQ01000571.1~~GHRQ01000571.1.p2  ORF type:complete len:112 (-),score=3.17 GHRQ01000571.1:181-516(-)